MTGLPGDNAPPVVVDYDPSWPARFDAIRDRIAPALGPLAVSIEHVRASPIGASVTVATELVHVDGRLLRFQVEAEHEDGVVVAHGEITRVVVDADRFLARL